MVFRRVCGVHRSRASADHGVYGAQVFKTDAGGAAEGRMIISRIRYSFFLFLFMQNKYLCVGKRQV